MPYVIERARKHGIRYTAIYTDENGRYKSAGTYDTAERAHTVAEQHESHVRLRLAETSPADKATITVRDFGVKFLREMIQRDRAYANVIHAAINKYAPIAIAAIMPAQQQVQQTLAVGEDPWVTPRYGVESLAKKLKVIGLSMKLPEVPPPPLQGM